MNICQVPFVLALGSSMDDSLSFGVLAEESRNSVNHMLQQVRCVSLKVDISPPKLQMVAEDQMVYTLTIR